MDRTYFETLIIYKLGSRKFTTLIIYKLGTRNFTTQNDLC